jgi:hypothetical protein
MYLVIIILKIYIFTISLITINIKINTIIVIYHFYINHLEGLMGKM